MTSSEKGNHKIVLHMAYLRQNLMITFLLLEKRSQPNYPSKMCRSGEIHHPYILLLLKVFALKQFTMTYNLLTAKVTATS